MPDASIHNGGVYWCDTSRSNIGTRFSDKERRPVLVVGQFGDYAAVYPCSTYRSGMDDAEWAGDLLGIVDTHIVYTSGLYYVPGSDLILPGVDWPDWSIWRRTHARIIEDDLRRFQQRHRDRLKTPVAGVSGRSAESFSASVGERLDEALRRRLAEMPPEPPAPPAPPPIPKPPPSRPPIDEFARAVEAILPYHVLKADEDADGETPKRPRPKQPSRSRRR